MCLTIDGKKQICEKRRIISILQQQQLRNTPEIDLWKKAKLEASKLSGYNEADWTTSEFHFGLSGSRPIPILKYQFDSLSRSNPVSRRIELFEIPLAIPKLPHIIRERVIDFQDEVSESEHNRILALDECQERIDYCNRLREVYNIHDSTEDTRELFDSAPVHIPNREKYSIYLEYDPLRPDPRVDNVFGSWNSEPGIHRCGIAVSL